jgi:hypothetical protein
MGEHGLALFHDGALLGLGERLTRSSWRWSLGSGAALGGTVGKAEERFDRACEDAITGQSKQRHRFAAHRLRDNAA